MNVKEIIPDCEVDRIHANANFGSMGKRQVIAETLLKCACGYDSGSTAMRIVAEHGLTRDNRSKGISSLTQRGRKYLWGRVMSKTTENQKLCKDCKHFSKYFDEIYRPIYECKNRKLAETDIVTGSKTCKSPWEARNPDGGCGPEAKLFKPKKTKGKTGDNNVNSYTKSPSYIIHPPEKKSIFDRIFNRWM